MFFSGGIFLTAGHVLDESYKHALGTLDGEQFVQIAGEERRIRSLLGRSPEKKKIGAPMMAISVRDDECEGSPVFILGENKFASAIEPTDVGLLAVDLTYSSSDVSWRWDTLPVSTKSPRPGDTVYCIGHHNYVNKEYMPYEELTQPNIAKIMSQFEHEFRVSMGTVTDVFVEKYVNGFADGPCFRIDCSIEHGQSGGPVINSDGYVCGINMCGTLDDDEDACLAATITPSFGVLTDIPESMSKREGMPKKVSLAQMIKRGMIATDEGLRNIAVLRSHGLETYHSLEYTVLTAERDGDTVPSKVRDRCGDLSKFHLSYLG